MKYAIALAAVLATSPAIAGDFDPRGNVATFESPVIDVNPENLAAEWEAYNELLRAGGCDADFIPVRYAAACWKAGVPNSVSSQPGASTGGDSDSSGGSQ